MKIKEETDAYVEERSAILAESLARLRTEAGLSVAELSWKSGVSASTIRRIEKGDANPRVTTLFDIATALGVNTGRLVSTKEEWGEHMSEKS